MKKVVFRLRGPDPSLRFLLRFYYVFYYVFTTFLTTFLLRFLLPFFTTLFTTFLMESVGDHKAACGILDTVRCRALDGKVVIPLAEPDPITMLCTMFHYVIYSILLCLNYAFYYL